MEKGESVPMEEQVDVLGRIKDLCQERNFSCYELAKRAGIPYSTLNTLFLKGTQPSLPTLCKICAGLGISVQQFFSQDSDAQTLTEAQKECLSLFSILDAEEQALAMAYMKGLAHKL